MGLASILALDLGTSSSRAAFYNPLGAPIPGAAAAEAHGVVTTPDGGAELDPEALIQEAARCCEGALRAAGTPLTPIAVGVSTFWHSFLGVDAAGRPVTPVSMWSDTRSVAQVEQLRRMLDERVVHARTGCRFHTSYLPARLLWLSQQRPELVARVRRWLSPGDYLFMRLFGDEGGLPGCSVSMASGTGLFNQETGDWDDELVSALPIEREQLPPIAVDAAVARGLAPEFAARLPTLRDVPWLPARGDGACSNVGSGCVRADRLALMVGTSGAMRVAVPGGAGEVPFGLWHYRLDRPRHLVGGALSNGGSLVAWLGETLRLDGPEALEAAIASQQPDGHGLTVLPFLMGERCPNWRGDARAAFVGLRQHTTPAEIARASVEAVAYRFAAIYDLLKGYLTPDAQVIASGKALASSPTWVQILADVLNRPVTISSVEELSARGAALLALETVGALAPGQIPDPPLGATFSPRSEAHAGYEDARTRHERLYQRLIAEAWRERTRLLQCPERIRL